MEITYYQGLDFIGHKFKIFTIWKEYGVKSKLGSYINPSFNVILESTQLVLGDLVWTYNTRETYVEGDECVIKYNSISSENQIFNAKIRIIHLVLGNLVLAYTVK